MFSKTKPLLVSTFSFPKKVENILIYEKLTPYAYQESIGSSMNPHNFGNFHRMKKAHHEHEANVKKVIDTLLKNGIQPQNIKKIRTRREAYDLLKYQAPHHACNRRGEEQTEDKSWRSPVFKPDLFISTGGDGTFLRASHLLDYKLGTNDVPILGINTNPELSEGRLCINTNGLSLPEIVELAINNSEVKVFRRNRIKVTMSSRNKTDFQTRDFHHNQIPLQTPEHKIRKMSSIDDPEYYNNMRIPIMALNDVFIGERAASMATNLELSYKLDQNNISLKEKAMMLSGEEFENHLLHPENWIQHHNQKNSGLIICTGTGSTGWSKSSNHICAETMRTVLSKIENECDCSSVFRLENDDNKNNKNSNGDSHSNLPNLPQTFTDLKNNNHFIKKLTHLINSTRTVFNPEDSILGVTFREPINSKISSGNDSNFIKVNALKAKSKLTYGMISIDGTTYYDFSRGAIVECESNQEYAINCITTKEYDDRDIKFD